MKILLITVTIMSLLVGCEMARKQLGANLLGEQFIAANEQVNHCNLSGLNYFSHAANDNSNKIVQVSSLLAIGGHYATVGDMVNVDRIVDRLVAIDPDRDFDEERTLLIKDGKILAQVRVGNGFTATCR
ncbi:hypothetical protein [Photobacterium kishitanii]|uniref:Lipoprotein n=1 Tax=Photobacterium kishitanii TaxID=318456 RepID=A0A2T3KL60_9GAMM|nr:hypothetical protein [Photobacterium kishitanii]PSV00406.1 hypothetical protein C9J27_04560 [Photobacterium kishitanii]